MREILTLWSGPGRAGKTTVMYFDEDEAAIDQVEALEDFWNAVATEISSAASCVVQPFGRMLNESTGTLTGTWAAGTGTVITGDVAAGPVADSTQGLVQWQTDQVIDGRLLRGRTFIPSIALDNIDAGNLTASARTAILNAAEALIVDVALGIWHRPKTVNDGALVSVTTASVWQEFAVLRRRRG